MKIIDCHAHVFPDKIAAKASLNIGAFYNLAMRFDGTVKALLDVCKKNNILKCLVNSVATVPEQVRNINVFIRDCVLESQGQFFGFAALHPGQSPLEIDDELSFINECGLKGIKLHPDFQKFGIDDRDAYKIYERIENKLPLLIHTGDSRFRFSSPLKLKTVLRDFPKLIIIAAHFGGWSEWEDAAGALADIPNVYVDTSSSLYEISFKKAMEYINMYTPERVLFGTDYPMWGADKEIEYINNLPLSEQEREKIFYKNAERLLDL
ncbi:MAG: amidohydrolase family protein [Eubacterium sp.]|jgi:predicted TIM-barrel fold metal-dependent hydrolase|nr:amidohydrolase family protein [Eubacterium sp.]